MMVYGYIKGPEPEHVAILQWGRDHKTEIHQILEDEPGKTDGMVELLALLGPGDKVVCPDPAQMWETAADEAIVRYELEKAGATCVFLSGDCAPSDEVVRILDALRQHEPIGQRVTLNRGRIQKARAGYKPMGQLPYGYRYDAGKHAVVDPSEAEVVRAMFSEGQKGQSLRQIAETLNQQGYTTRTGKKWQSGTIQPMLRNRFYIGELTYNDEVIQGKHEPIISRVQFGKVAAQLTRRHK